MSEKPKRDPVSSVPPPSQCPACGGTTFERGVLAIPNGGYQQTERKVFPVFLSVSIAVAFRCLTCNRLEFYVDEILSERQRMRYSGVFLLAIILFVALALFMFFVYLYAR
jgi:predicted nucleic-acid-binding Zn-ribbon protein